MKKILIVLGIVAAVIVFGCVGTSVLVSALGKAREKARASRAAETVAQNPTPTAAPAPQAELPKVDAPKTAAPQIDKSEEKQAEREKFIQTLSASGIFGDSRSNGRAARVVVKPGFYDLDFKTKEKYLSVVYAYYWDGKDESFFMRLLDSRTNKEVGQYSKSAGGLELE